jgi:glycosyltransferase involved in cell wall biosynthesis
MKVAIVTPYHDEHLDVLRRCHDSVLNQTIPAVHVMVGDGHSRWPVDGWTCEHYKLPYAHADAGATPRAIGALSAFSRGYDVVMFLDADNWYESEHVKIITNILAESGADAVIATRTIHAQDGSALYVDRIESNGENMIDTNTWALTRKCLPLLHAWIVEPQNRLWSDRYFDRAMRSSALKIARCDVPTVAYVTKWAWHYQHAGQHIPDDAVWIHTEADGTLVHRRHGG